MKNLFGQSNISADGHSSTEVLPGKIHSLRVRIIDPVRPEMKYLYLDTMKTVSKLQGLGKRHIEAKRDSDNRKARSKELNNAHQR